MFFLLGEEFSIVVAMDPLDFFPYSPRNDQRKAIKKIYEYASKGENIFFQAPTGYGKTPVILAALLPLAIEYDLPIIWAVRTGGETDRVIEELVEIDRKTDEDLFGLSFRGKKDMCLLARQIGVKDFDSVTELCRKLKNKCPFYANLKNKDLGDIGSSPLIFSDILETGKAHGVCPYYLQFKLIRDAKVVSLNYNYVLSERYSKIFWRNILKYGAFLVIDEAHNIDKAVSELYSTKISLNTAKRALNEAERYLYNSEYLDTILSLVEKTKNLLAKEAITLSNEDAPFKAEEFLEVVEIDEDELELLDRAVELIIDRKIKENKAPRSYLKSLKRFLEAIRDDIDEEGVEFIKYRDNNNVYFEVWDLRVTEILTEIWTRFESIVFTSGTLKPYEAFAEVTGVNNYNIVEGTFTIPEENVLPIIYKDVTTKGEELEEDMVIKYCNLLNTVIENFPRNLAIFNASYRIQNHFEECLKKTAKKLGRPIFIEYEKMRGDELKEMYLEFVKSKNAILVGIMGGRFAEGMDYPGEALEGIVLVGIPFDRVNFRTKKKIEYYSKKYGDTKGRYYSYIVPALRKASQAMGRSIRSPNDKALIIAADSRYTYPVYFNLLPEYFVLNVKIVKSITHLVKYIKAFTGDNY